MNESKPSPHKRWRWWLALPVLALLIAGGVVRHRISLGPELRPAASSLLANNLPDNRPRFSAQGMGYPAVAMVMVESDKYLMPEYRVLDDLCRPTDVTVGDSARISPTRAVVTWGFGTWGISKSDSQYHIYNPNGNIAYIPITGGGLFSGSMIPFSDGVIGDNSTGNITKVRLYDPTGRELPSPQFAWGRKIATRVGINDDHLIPMTDDVNIYLYDRTNNSELLNTYFSKDEPTMIWRQEDRLLLAPRSGKAQVFDGTKQIALITPLAGGWRWGEDGTVWTLSNGKLRLLRWCTGAPELVSIPTRGKPGKRYGSLAPGLPDFHENKEPDWAAVWGDGELTASVEYVAPTYTAFLRVAEGAMKKRNIAREIRRLTLYRDRQCLGHFQIHMAKQSPTMQPPSTSNARRARRQNESNRMRSTVQPPSSSNVRVAISRPPAHRPATMNPMPDSDPPPAGAQNPANHEHLAFTKDGKYLSWAIDDGDGVRLFVFEVPEI